MTEQLAVDDVIVGAGSTGSVLANRRSAHLQSTVCLLEPGPGDNSPFSRMPIGIIYVMTSRRRSRRYLTAAQPHLDGRPLFWPRGKTLGGIWKQFRSKVKEQWGVSSMIIIWTRLRASANSAPGKSKKPME